jgi:group I intron endonuclease
LINGKRYVGSAVDFRRRMLEYFNINYLERKKYMPICRALLKYGYSKFSLEILEYCQPSEVISREQFFIDLLQPDYNILAIAGSSLGFKQSEETKAKISEAKKGKNNPMFGRTGKNHPMYGKARHAEAGSPSQQIEVFDIKNNTTITYNSIGDAARALNL